MKNLQKILMGSMFLFLFSGNNSYCNGDYEGWSYERLKQELENSIKWMEDKLTMIQEDIQSSKILESTKTTLLATRDKIKRGLDEIKNKVGSMSSDDLKKSVVQVVENIRQRIDQLFKSFRDSKSAHVEKSVL